MSSSSSRTLPSLSHLFFELFNLLSAPSINKQGFTVVKGIMFMLARMLVGREARTSNGASACKNLRLNCEIFGGVVPS